MAVTEVPEREQAYFCKRFLSLYKMFVYWLEQVTWPTLGKGIMSHAAKGMETGSRKNGGH